jgi:hypothetical protein
MAVSDKQMLGLGLGIIIALALNFLPSMVAYARRHPDRKLLAGLNILSLLSFLLWLALLGWAVGGTRNDALINRYVHNRALRPLLIGLVVALVGGGLFITAQSLRHMPLPG